MLKISLLLLLNIAVAASWAQSRQVSGIVKDSGGDGIIAATVILISAKDTLFARTDTSGRFSFRNMPLFQFEITVTSLGYVKFNRHYDFRNETASLLVLEPIILKEEHRMLGQVVIMGSHPITIKEDTVEYNASDFPVRENAVVEDILKKLDGIEIDKDGTVTAQGKNITRVRVNGKDFFNGDLKTAMQQLPADIIDKIQVIDDYGDQANFTGVKDGEPEKIINIQIKPDRNRGVYGRAIAGSGNEGRYRFNANGNYFNEDQRLSLTGGLNNTNSSSFNFQQDRNNNGITTRGAAGINYSDDISEKVEVNGSYRYSGNSNKVETKRFVESVNQLGTIFESRVSDASRSGSSHSFNGELEYRPDSANFFELEADIDFDHDRSSSGSFTSQTGVIWEDQLTKNGSFSNSPEMQVEGLFNHSFKKRGRFTSLRVSINRSDNSEERDVEDEIVYKDTLGNSVKDSSLHRLINRDNQRFRTGLRFTYNEPVSLYSSLQFTYDYGYRKYDNSRITDTVNASGALIRDDRLSNIYNYSFTENRFSLNYRYNNRTVNYSLGIAFQPTQLKGMSESRNTRTRRQNVNILPVARFSYHISRTRSIRLRYSGRSNEPDYSQVQAEPDVTNPRRPIIGNPDLKASLDHSLNMEYNSSPIGKASFSASLSGQLTQNAIVRNAVLVKDTIDLKTNNISLIRETHFLNENGNYGLSGYYSWSKWFSERRYNLSLSGSVNYNNSISYTDFVKNTGQNWRFRQRLRMQINPAEWIELNPQVRYSHSINTYTLAESNDRKISSWSLDMDGRFYFLKTFTLGFGADKDINRGYPGSIRANPFILTAYFEKQFFRDKLGSLRIQAYDLLNQGTNLDRTVTDNSIIDSQSNRLTQYFMVTFSMRLKKFTGDGAG